MCGVFGFVTNEGQGPDLRRLEVIARANEQRGPHAFGFAWVDGRGRLHCYKQTGRIGDHLGLLAMAHDARLLIGHTRYATQGDPADNQNNHPHPCDGGWIVHNGMIPGYRKVQARCDMRPVTDCDSETIAMLITEADGTLMERTAKAMDKIETDNAVVLGLWSRPGRLVIARRGNPVRIGRTAAGAYFGSLAGGLPSDAKMIADNVIRQYTIDKEGKSNVRQHEEESGRAAEVQQRSPQRVLSVPALGVTAEVPGKSRTRPRFVTQ